MDHFDEQNGVKRPFGAHKIASAEKDQEIIVNELQTMEVFGSIASRAHDTFLKLRDPITKRLLEN